MRVRGKISGKMHKQYICGSISGKPPKMTSGSFQPLAYQCGTGCPKKNVPKIVWIISSATSTLDGWGISHLKVGLVAHIGKQSYKQNDMGYHISRYQIIHHFKFLKSDTPYHFAYISASQYGTEMFLYSRQSYKSHLSNEICLSHLACL